jgi:UDP-galactopyranose mutase
MKTIYVIGSGFFGSTFANLAANAGYKVELIEKRDYVGGNACSKFDEETGIEYHTHGTHVFHTSNKKIWDYVNQFSEFNDFKLFSCTTHKGKVYPLPINLHTISMFYDKQLTPSEAKKIIEEDSIGIKDSEDNLEDKAISRVGRKLYEAFFKDYTWKQWQTDLRLLPPETITRIPVRYNYNSRLFSDKYEGLPIDGYIKVFERMTTHKNININLNTDFFDIKDSIKDDDFIIYSGPIDKYFNYKHGELGWRTSYFEKEIINENFYQGTGLMYFPSLDIPYTRIHEFKHFNPERNYTEEKTLILKEYSKFTEIEDEPCYPINSKKDKSVVKLYKEEAEKEKNVIFGGRLGSYKYLDMHMAIGNAMSKFEDFIRR